MNLTGWHGLIVLVVILLLFGSTKLPGLAKGIAQSLKIFKNEIKEESPTESKDTNEKDNKSENKN